MRLVFDQKQRALKDGRKSRLGLNIVHQNTGVIRRCHSLEESVGSVTVGIPPRALCPWRVNLENAHLTHFVAFRVVLAIGADNGWQEIWSLFSPLRSVELLAKSPEKFVEKKCTSEAGDSRF